MACHPVTYALCWLVMASSASQAKEEETNNIHDRISQVYGDKCPSYSTVKRWAAMFKTGRTSLDDDLRSGRPSTSFNEDSIKEIEKDRCLTIAEREEDTAFTLDPSRSISSIVHPQSGTTKHVQEGTNVTLVCQNAPGNEKNADVLWYRTVGTHETYSVFVQCHISLVTAKKLDGKGSCFNKSYGLRIQNIDKQNEERWYCLVNNKWQSPYVEIKVDRHNESTLQRISSPTTTTVKDVTLTSKSTKDTTEYTTERTDKEPASLNTLVPLIGGAAGGAFVLLALVITGCVLYRSKREVNKPNDEPASTTDSNRDPGANVEGAVVIEENLMYGNDDYAQIPCREPASASHEKVDASVLKNQPDTEDRNTNQPGVDSGDIYAIPDKPKKSTVEDVEDVYSQVQKPKKGIE